MSIFASYFKKVFKALSKEIVKQAKEAVVITTKKQRYNVAANQ